MTAKMHINLFIHGRGHHEAAWRYPGNTALKLTNIKGNQKLAQLAEKGLLDSVFLADSLAMGADIKNVARGELEPITTLTALSAVTQHIGLIGTASTTYTEPFNLARQFASLDHISNGRAGWNIVTSWVPGVEANYSHDRQPSHAERYDRAFEFLDIVTQLWDSWADDAVVDDPVRGLYADPTRIKAINHHGKYWNVAGPLNIPRPPQGHPLLVQAGSSPQGQRFAARYAEAVFTAHLELSSAQTFYRELKGLTAAQGRRAQDIVILPGISPVIGESEKQAEDIWQQLNALTSVETGLARLTSRFGGYDFSHLPLDLPLSVDDFPDPTLVQAAQSRAVVITDLVRRQRPTLRQLLHQLAGARGHFTLAGTPERIADTMQTWFEQGAADGFNLMPPVLPTQLEIFIDQVLPILQRRGLFRTAYDGETLRDHYNLPRPANALF